MKHIFYLMALFLAFSLQSYAADEGETVKQATWDWTDSSSPVYSSGTIESTTAWLKSDQSKIDDAEKTSVTTLEGFDYEKETNFADYQMYVDATSGKLNSNNGNAQFNQGTKLYVPVFNYGDKVSVSPYVGSNYTAQVKIGELEVANVDKTATTYTASTADIANGYVVITATGNGYIYSVTVDYVEEAEAETALWDFQTGNPTSITSVSIESTTGYVMSTASEGATLKTESAEGTSVKTYEGEETKSKEEYFADCYMYVDATSGKFDVAGRTINYDVQVNSGTKIQVPVKSPGDKITIVPNYYYDFTVGGIAATSTNTWVYIASVEEYNQGYVEIVSTGNCYFYSIQWDAYDGETQFKDSNLETTESSDGITGIVKWDWATSGWTGQTNISSSQALVSSSNENVSMYIDAPTGTSSLVRFDDDQKHVQVYKDVVFYIPCEKGDILTVNAYNGEQYVHYTIGNDNTIYSTSQTHTISALDFTIVTDLDNDTQSALVAISEQCGRNNFIALTSADNNNYYLSIQMEYMEVEGSVKTKCLYSTSWTEWEQFERKTASNLAKTVSASYGAGDITFTFNGVGVYPEGEISNYVGYMETAKYTNEVDFEPSVVTSAISSVTKIELSQAATGSKRGIMVSVKGDGDDDWVYVHQKAISSQSGESLTIDCGNRTNCQIKFENLYAEDGSVDDGRNQNAYVTDLAIYGKIDFGDNPMLDTFTFNDEAFTGDEVFKTKDAYGNWIGTIQITKVEEYAPSATNLPKVLSVDNGKLASENAINYTAPATDEKYGTVTIKVINDGVDPAVEATYILSFEDKPDYTVSYYYNGTVAKEQTVEKDATIGTFAVTATELGITDPAILRGWVLDTVKGNKIDEDYVITADLNIYALVTDRETQNGNSRYKYNFTDKYFDIDDHECVSTEGGSFHDNQHGYEVNSGTVTLQVGSEAYIIFGMCMYDATGSTITLTIGEEVVDEITDIVSKETFADGEAYVYHYEGGTPATVVVTTTGDIYFHYITISNVADLDIAPPTMADGDYFYFVEPIDGNDDATNKKRADEFLTLLDIAGATTEDNQRAYIFLPDGTYDLGYECLTPVPNNNMSIIGQSMTGTIIKNEAPEEGIAVSATLFNSTTGLYMQDLTLQNAYDYYGIGGTGRADCFQDEGKHTICKNVRMLSYQDTYYSHNDNEHYFETSEIHGIVDYICGSGDIYFYQCTLYNEGRSGYQTPSTSPTYMTAPNTAASCNFGYVFESCIVDGIDGQCYSFGRSWDATARCIWLNTTLKDGGRNIYSYRWYEGSMNVNPTLFGEYGTLPECPTTNVVPFNCTSTVNMETILTNEQASEYDYDKVFDTASWDPMAECEQVEISDLIVTVGSAEISWSGNNNALTYGIFLNTKLVGFTGQQSFTLSEAVTEDDYIEVRAANQNGGFGQAITFGVKPSSIATVSNDAAELVGVAYYDLTGRKLVAPQRGINIAIEYYSDGSQKSTKLLTK